MKRYILFTFIFLVMSSAVIAQDNVSVPECDLHERAFLWFKAIDEPVILETDLTGLFSRAQRRIIFSDGRVIELPEGGKFFDEYKEGEWASCEAHLEFSKREIVESVSSGALLSDHKYDEIWKTISEKRSCDLFTENDFCTLPIPGESSYRLFVEPSLLEESDIERLSSRHFPIISVTASTYFSVTYALDRDENRLIELFSSGD